MASVRQQAEELFHQAVELSPNERTDFIERHCADGTPVRLEVDLLFTALDTPPIPALQAVELLDQDDTTLVGESVGPHRILELIGEGGLGTVYLAQQQKPFHRQVALKVIRPGMDTRQVVARFETERQALAIMEHPNIAKVFDGGATEAGRPYFVMELVKGVPITEYADRNRLTVRQRLRLFVEVCNAIQHAHQKGVIHRDIKPSNVLVTMQDGTAVPKIIDFGIAKAISGPLTDKTLVTTVQQLIGTPEYASPEQLEIGELDVDTRSDVYSLGALLYELLTGMTPFDTDSLRKSTYREILRIVREEDPLTPSRRLSTSGSELVKVANCRRVEPRTLGNVLRGDLDWIVMKALEKNRTRRYDTATALASDIERHLANEPVLADPPSALYRFRKTVARHKAAFGFVSALFVLVACFGIWMGLLYGQADELRRQAEQQRGLAEANLFRARVAEERAKTEADFLHELLASVDPDIAQSREISLRYILDEAVRKIDKGWLEEHPEAQAAVRMTIAKTYFSLGLYTEAEGQVRLAEKAYRGLLGHEHPETLRARYWLGATLRGTQRVYDGGQIIGRNALTQTRVLGAEHPDTLRSMNVVAITYWYPSTYAKAEKIHRETLEAQRRVLGNDHEDTLTSMVNLGGVLSAQGRNAEAETVLREALDHKRRILGEEHTDVAGVAISLSSVLRNQAKRPEAETLLRNALEIHRKVFGSAHHRTRVSLALLRGILRAQGKLEEARPYIVEELARLKRTAESDDASASALYSYAWSLLNCELSDLRDPESALPAAQQAVELDNGETRRFFDALALAHLMVGDIDSAIEAEQEANTVFFEHLGAPYPVSDAMCLMGFYLKATRDFDGAAEVYRSMLERGGGDIEPTDSAMADALFLHGQEATSKHEYDEAEVLLRACLAIQSRILPPGDPQIAATMSMLAVSLLRVGMFEEAESLLMDAYNMIADNTKVSGEARQEILQRIIELYEGWNMPDEAAQWSAELPEFTTGTTLGEVE
ncbi:MAG: serine/threonine protein kinase [Phycisphaerales bacterium]|nr:MAG: serine/threonine protein kinase [Phycisphaerales bacterium]